MSIIWKQKKYLDEDECVIVNTFNRAVWLKQFSDKAWQICRKTSDVWINIAHNNENDNGELNTVHGDGTNNLHQNDIQPSSVKNNLQDQQNASNIDQSVITNPNNHQTNDHNQSTNQNTAISCKYGITMRC